MRPDYFVDECPWRHKHLGYSALRDQVAWLERAHAHSRFCEVPKDPGRPNDSLYDRSWFSRLVVGHWDFDRSGGECEHLRLRAVQRENELVFLRLDQCDHRRVGPTKSLQAVSPALLEITISAEQSLQTCNVLVEP